MNKFDLFIESVKNLKTVGTITFSSKFAVKKMIKPIDFSKAKCIVELGAGNGVITKGLLKHMREDAELLAFEINEKFCEKLEEINDPRLVVIDDSAEKLSDYLLRNNWKQADYIISAIPLVLLDDDLFNSIMSQAVESLAPEGIFVQIQYSKLSIKRIRKYFNKIEEKFVTLNVPPAFIFYCQNDPAKS